MPNGGYEYPRLTMWPHSITMTAGTLFSVFTPEGQVEIQVSHQGTVKLFTDLPVKRWKDYTSPEDTWKSNA